MTLGIMFNRQNTPRHTVNSLVNCVRDNDVLQITLEEKTVKKIKTQKANATVHYIIRNNELFQVEGKIIVYFKNNNTPQYGARILIKGQLQLINGSGNPGSFDYSKYALMMGLTHQIFIDTSNYFVIDSFNSNVLLRSLESTRNTIVELLRRYIPDERNAGLAEALLIGYKNDLDKELVHSYSSTGVVHIVAISGLHVGLIYLLLLYILKPLRRIQVSKYVIPVVILLGLWSFTFLAGAQPSVLRSTIMFSFIVIGQILTQKSSVYNSLALSAFFLLCYNPSWLWDFGFQLSYSAVFSILLFSQPIYRCLYFANKFIDLIWKLTAATIAAQILTTPFCIYYFHQFPLYFLISNFIAVPLSSLILLLEILLCFVSPFCLIASCIGSFVNLLIRLMNYCINSIQNLPYSLLQDIQINLAQACLLAIFLYCISYWLNRKSIIYFRMACIGLISFLLIELFTLWQTDRQRALIIYNLQSGTAFEFVNGRRYYLFADDSVLRDKYITDNYFNPCHILYQTKPAMTDPGYFGFGPFHSFFNLRMIFAKTPFTYNSVNEKISIDIVLIDNKTKIDLEKLSAMFKIKWIVVGNKVQEKAKVQYQKEAEKLGILYHNLSTKGAFVITLR